MSSGPMIPWKTKFTVALSEHKFLFSQLWRLMIWEKPFHPVITFLVVTILFWIISISKATVITTAAAVGILCVLVDFAGPGIYHSLEPHFGPARDLDYDAFCGYLSLPIKLLDTGIHKLIEMKRRQKAVLSGSLAGVLFITIFIGRINNYYLCYLSILSYLMAPGALKRAGINVNDYTRLGGPSTSMTSSPSPSPSPSPISPIRPPTPPPPPPPSINRFPSPSSSPMNKNLKDLKEDSKDDDD
ncbi:uncharacterized protein LOC107367312 [Tetranychus urticae]|uniref:RETREG1-3/ARL6IP-like N-terminal reticulon-homology domain-containing protein n=1 Tax=Tetranychus urticae TaxID=32264 RepID=T1KU24_TETUR|nr:uncharacterized protein LOC107367312 [Tetranychus urticae]